MFKKLILLLSLLMIPSSVYAVDSLVLCVGCPPSLNGGTMVTGDMCTQSATTGVINCNTAIPSGVATDTIWANPGDLPQGTGLHTAAVLIKGATGTLLRAGASSVSWSALTMPDTIGAGGVFVAQTANILTELNSTSGTKYLKNINGVWSLGTSTITAIGSDTQVPYNYGGSSMAGSSGFTFNYSSNTLLIGGEYTFNADYYPGTDLQKLSAAINAAQTVNGTVVLSRVYAITAGPITISDGCKIVGNGMPYQILSSDGSHNIFTIATDQPVIMEDLYIGYQGGTTPNSGTAGIYVTTGGSASNQKSRFRNVTVLNAYTGIHFFKAANWVIDSSNISEFYNTGLWVENQYLNDEGDSTVKGSIINTSRSATQNVLWQSSGGLRFQNNKVIGNSTAGFVINPNGTGGASATSIILINGNSIEGMTPYGIVLERTSGASTLSLVTIQGNEIVVYGTPIAQSSSSWLSSLTVTGNVMASITADSTTISLDGVSVANVSGNTIGGGGGGSSLGVNVTSNSAYVKVGPNVYGGVATNVTNASTTSYVQEVVGTISYGANDSGGTGYKLLRVPN